MMASSKGCVTLRSTGITSLNIRFSQKAAFRFLKRFSLENYFLPAEHPDEELRVYLSGLLNCARQQRRTPLFKFCRFGLRTLWFLRNFSSRVIYVLRAPDAMFRSYWSFGGPKSYFIFVLAMIVSKNRNCELFTEAAVRFGIPPVEKSSVAEEMTDIHALTKDFDPQTWRDLFLLLWSLHLQHNLVHCDLLLDMDLLATSKPYRKRIERRLSHLTSTRLSFSEVRLPRAAEAPGDLLSPTGVELARNALRRLPEKNHLETRASLGVESLRTFEALL